MGLIMGSDVLRISRGHSVGRKQTGLLDIVLHGRLGAVRAATAFGQHQPDAR